MNGSRLMRLRRSEVKVSRDFSCGLRYLEGATENIDPTAAQSDEFAPSKTSVGKDINHRLVLAAWHCLCQSGDLFGREVAV